MQGEDLRRVMEVLSLKEQHARTLLIHYRWDVEKLLTVLVEKGKDELYTRAGVNSVEHENFVLSKSSSSTVMCIVCMEEVPADEVTTMDCGHCFCNSCEYYFVCPLEYLSVIFFSPHRLSLQLLSLWMLLKQLLKTNVKPLFLHLARKIFTK